MRTPTPPPDRSAQRPLASWSGLAVLWLAAACSTLPRSGPGRGAVPSEPYPPFAAVGPLRVEARYYLDQAELLGGDLLGAYGLVPIALRMGVVDTGFARQDVAAVPQDMGLVLHLADGTPLMRAAPDEVDVRRRRLERLVREAFEGGLLPPWEQAREGFVYFEIPAGFYVDARMLTLTHPAEGGTRTLDLRDSLLSLELVVDGEVRAVHVGLQLDRSGARLDGEQAP